MILGGEKSWRLGNNDESLGVELKPHRREIQGGDEDSSSKPRFSFYLPYVLPLLNVFFFS